MNYFDSQDDENTDFRDTPDEVNGMDAAPVTIRTVRPPQAQQPIQPPPQKTIMQEYEENPELDTTEEDENDEEEMAAVLTDARLRLEQGKLYEMLMNHNMFEGIESDEKAIKNVQREIKKFAQERMELMLGMRQTMAVAPDAPAAMSVDAFPFNALEVEVLKALAAGATEGKSREADRFVPEEVPAARKTLNPISRGGGQKPAPRPVAKKSTKPLPSKPKQAVRRPQVTEAIQRILEEEGLTMEQINEVYPEGYEPTDITQLTPEQLAEHNKQIARRTQRKAHAPNTAPMPTQDQINHMYEQQVARAAPAIDADPNMRKIMDLLLPKR